MLRSISHMPFYLVIDEEHVMRLFLTCLMITLGTPHLLFAQDKDVRSVTRSFIDAYALADAATVLRAIDERTIVYGGSANQVVRGTRGVKDMLARDAHMWAGKARIGEMKDVSTSNEGSLETIFFNANLVIGNHAPLPVRFCMVWRTGTIWRLLQASTAIVAKGSSTNLSQSDNP